MPKTSRNQPFKEHPHGKSPPDSAIGRMLSRIHELPAEERRRRQRRIDFSAQEISVQLAITEDREKPHAPPELDLIPRIIPDKDWSTISAGVIQRVSAFNAFLHDIYHDQRILHDKILPPDAILNDAAYYPQCRDLEIPRRQHLHFAALDLVRNHEGRWLVSQHHFSMPSGISHVIQNRRMLERCFPEIFEEFPVQPISTFPVRFNEVLSDLTPAPYPHIVSLSYGDSSETFFEEIILARRMGISIVKPSDLIVRDGMVHLKTVAGLEKVDVILRRIGTRSIDPITFGNKEYSGIPGLVHCVRKGTVVVANALGAALADNKALLRNADGIVRYYLGEEPILGTVPTFFCGDYDQLEHVRQSRDEMILRSVHRDLNRPKFHLPSAADLSNRLTTRPNEIVAQPQIMVSHYPRLIRNQVRPRSVYLRVFCLLGENPYVLPGGLSRQTIEPGLHDQREDEARGVKDTWVLAPTGKVARRFRSSSVPPKEVAISSRCAESLYWIGRYAERAENTARMVTVLHENRWEELGKFDREKLEPLWNAAAINTGSVKVSQSISQRVDQLLISRVLLVDPEEPASAKSCISAAQYNADQIREFVSPEFWQILYDLYQYLHAIPSPKKVKTGTVNEIGEHIIHEVACLEGTGERSMPHDAGWQFFKIGTLVERSLRTVTILQEVLSSSVLAVDSSGENPDLTTLLALLGSLDAYRREYRSRAYGRQVAELLWKNPEPPSSVRFCLDRLHRHLTEVKKVHPESDSDPTFQQITEIQAFIEEIPIHLLFADESADSLQPKQGRSSSETKSNRIHSTSTNLQTKLAGLHELIDDSFFAHQQGFKK